MNIRKTAIVASERVLEGSDPTLGHANRCDPCTMAPFDAMSDVNYCPACRHAFNVAPVGGADAALLLRKLPQLFANVAGTKPTPRCVYCRLPTLVRTDSALPLAFLTTDDVIK